MGVMIDIKENESLSKHTTFKLGGPARYLVAAKTKEDIIEAVNFAKEKELPFYILGGGSNILIRDEGYNGVIIKPQIGGVRIEEDRISIAIKFSQETGTYLVLKGAPTVIAEPEGSVFVNSTGNPGMASAGVGDVLTGMIAGLLGQGLNPLEASILGVYMHGFAGDIAANKKGEHSLIASDMINSLPDAFLSLGKIR